GIIAGKTRSFGPLGGGPHEKPFRKPLEICRPHRFDRLGTAISDGFWGLYRAEAGRTLSIGATFPCRRRSWRVGRGDCRCGFHHPTIDEKPLIGIPAGDPSPLSHSSAVRRVFH